MSKSESTFSAGTSTAHGRASAPAPHVPSGQGSYRSTTLQAHAAAAQVPVWERLSVTDVRQRAEACCTRAAQAYKLTTPRDMTAVFSPLTGTMSSGILTLDTLLARAASVDPFSAFYHRTDSAFDEAESNAASSHAGFGGWTTGSLNELYGPPLSGKTFVLQRTAAAFLRSQERLMEEANRQAQCSPAEAPHVSMDVPSYDLYVCCFGGGPAAEEGWARQLGHLADASLHTKVPLPSTAGRRDHVHLVALSHPNELLAFLAWLADELDATADALLCAPHEQVPTPCGRLPDRRNTAVKQGSREHEDGVVKPRQVTQQKRASARTTPSPSPVPSQTPEALSPSSSQHAFTDSQGSSHLTVQQRRSNRKRSRSVVVATAMEERHTVMKGVSGSATEASPLPDMKEVQQSTQGSCDKTADERRLPQRHHHQVLLLVDSMAHVWQHTALQGSQHSVRWFSLELQRLLRRCLARRQVSYPVADAPIKSSGAPCKPPHDVPSSFLLTTTALIANGSTRFLNLSTFSQRQQPQQPLSSVPPPSCQRLIPIQESKAALGVGSSKVKDQGSVTGDVRTPRAAIFSPAVVTPAMDTSSRSIEGGDSSSRTTLGGCGYASSDCASHASELGPHVYPLGDETWLTAPDCRLLLRPFDFRLSSITPSLPQPRHAASPQGKGRMGSRNFAFTPVPRVGQPVGVVEVIWGAAGRRPGMHCVLLCEGEAHCCH